MLGKSYWDLLSQTSTFSSKNLWRKREGERYGWMRHQFVFLIQVQSENRDGAIFTQHSYSLGQNVFGFPFGEEISSHQGVWALRDNHEWMSYPSHSQVFLSLVRPWIVLGDICHCTPCFFYLKMVPVLVSRQNVAPCAHKKNMASPSTFRFTYES